ncbi:MAG: hypothetical protein GC196_04310, partial [Hyphomonas sp.]|nr:hypothetical protein [Hyphomonas sp.]
MHSGAITVGRIDAYKSCEAVFDHSQSLVFKQLAVPSIYDAGSDSLMYGKRCERPTDLTGSLSALFRRALRFGLEQSFGTNGATFVGFGWEPHKP